MHFSIQEDKEIQRKVYVTDAQEAKTVQIHSVFI